METRFLFEETPILFALQNLPHANLLPHPDNANRRRLIQLIHPLRVLLRENDVLFLFPGLLRHELLRLPVTIPNEAVLHLENRVVAELALLTLIDPFLVIWTRYLLLCCSNNAK